MMTDIENLYECYAGDVRRFALYLCSDVAMADEIISDTFMCAWMAADRIRPVTLSGGPFLHARSPDGTREFRSLVGGRNDAGVELFTMIRRRMQAHAEANNPPRDT